MNTENGPTELGSKAIEHEARGRWLEKEREIEIKWKWRYFFDYSHSKREKNEGGYESSGNIEKIEDDGWERRKEKREVWQREEKENTNMNIIGFY